MTLLRPKEELVRTYYVFFQDREERNWWDYFTKKGFRHVFIASETNDPITGQRKGFTVLNYALGQMENIIGWDVDINSYIGHVMAEDPKTKVVKVTIDPCEGYPLRFSLNCVSLAKAFMGIGDHYGLTPYSLYRYLRNKPTAFELINLNGGNHYGWKECTEARP